MKKILLVNTTVGMGGAPGVVRTLFKYLNTSGLYEAHIAYGRGPISSDPSMHKIGYQIEVILHALITRISGLEGIGSFFSTRRLIRLIEREQFDIVHLHNIHGYYLNFPKFFSYLKRKKIPVFWTLHDEWPMNALKAHSMGCDHCVTGAGQCTSLYGYPRALSPIFASINLSRKQHAFSGMPALTIIAPARWLAEKIATTFLSAYAIRYIPNGIDVSVFHPADDKRAIRKKYGISEDAFVVHFSALHLRDVSKGASIIEQVAARVQNEKYVFVGIGGTVSKSWGNVQILPATPDIRLRADYYALADVYCMPSYAETAPLAVLEAMASGIPIIGFDIPALREIVGTISGVLVEPGDADGLVHVIKDLASDHKVCETYGVRARDEVIAHFTERQFLENSLALYRGV